MKSPYLLVIADGVLTMFPVANIRASLPSASMGT